MCWVSDREVGDGLSPQVQVAFRSPTRLAALLLLERGPHTPSQLGEALGFSRQVMQVHVNRLLEAGLVREAERSTVRGGTTIAYVAVRRGWARQVDQLNALGRTPADGSGA